VLLDPVWSALLIFGACFFAGGVPLSSWAVRFTSGKRLTQLGTGNIGVSAAFYHGGTWVGLLVVLLEAAKGIGAVLLAQSLLPGEGHWQLLALMALVAGRASFRQGAGTTNVVWGCLVYDWQVAALVFVIAGIGFTLVRERRQGRWLALIVLPLVIYFLRHNSTQTLIAMILSGLLALIYQQIPDDLDLQAEQAKPESKQVFKFFQGSQNILSLAQPLTPEQAGRKAANLAQLTRWGYAVPRGWVLPAGDDPDTLVETLHPSLDVPLIVRSSALGEDSQEASAAGQYLSVPQVTSRWQLAEAIRECQQFYDQPQAQQYRQDQGIAYAFGLAVLVQEQIKGVFSGVAFSRDPVQRDAETVAIEALPGGAQRVVSGQVQPEAYQVMVPNQQAGDPVLLHTAPHLDIGQFAIQGELGQVPPQLLCRVALLARELEGRYHGIPQDLEWSFDGQTLWVLQTRPITTLAPIWTRKIAAEVIPGVIRPLTWSINRPLTCGVWGQLFTLVLGPRARGLDFQDTATLHWGRAYFNASLLGDIFRRMGLPPESLEFLTRGAKMSRPSLGSTLRTVPGLLRLWGRELRLQRDWQGQQQQLFRPLLTELAATPAQELPPPALGARIEQILTALLPATHYSILAPLSAALRTSVLKIKDTELDHSQTPEAAALSAIRLLATSSRQVLGDLADYEPDQLYLQLSEHPAGQSILTQLNALIERYGYLSAVGTDIAVPTWREDPQPVRELFRQLLFEAEGLPHALQPNLKQRRGLRQYKVRLAQNRLTLKGLVAATYNQLLAELRWSLLALEQEWLRGNLLHQAGDIFFLEYEEIRQVLASPDSAGSTESALTHLIQQRRQQFQADQERTTVQGVVYGQPAAHMSYSSGMVAWSSTETIQGIGASPGEAIGQVKIVHDFTTLPTITRQTIVVVPYTDAGWAPILARAAGIIAEVGGRLSHGAIVAREYQIPAVMDVAHATQRFQDGQWVRINGSTGIVERLEAPPD
jgi:phosphohistidine swiveling domain-containing protein/glycerol-3-phosphate acyltransferase PlsY